MLSNMKARCLVDRRVTLSATAFAELVLWEVPEPVAGSAHRYKYRLALVEREVCVLRYDNEAGKGDHMHVGAVERPYRFEGIDGLLADFGAHVKEWLDANRNP